LRDILAERAGELSAAIHVEYPPNPGIARSKQSAFQCCMLLRRYIWRPAHMLEYAAAIVRPECEGCMRRRPFIVAAGRWRFVTIRQSKMSRLAMICMSKLLIGLLIIFLFAAGEPASAQCAPGMHQCGDGLCATIGGCCPNGTSCRPGNICTWENTCLPLGDPRVCPEGKNYCPVGSYCNPRDSKCHKR
jgi:hypothetical protein